MKHLTSTALALILAAGAARAETTIDFALWGSPEEGEVWKTIAAEFEAAHPDIKVNIEVADWDGYWEKLRVQVAGGEPPDVFAMDAPLYPDWQSRGVLLNLQPYLDANPSALDGVYPITLEAYRTPDGLFGLPRDFQTIVLYYNKDMFDAAGQSYPDDTWSYDDFRAAAARLTLDANGDGVKEQWGFWAEVYDMEPFWGPVVWAWGGSPVDPAAGTTLVNTPEAQAAFQFIHDMWKVDGSMPSEQELAQYGYDGFLAGVAAMGFSGHWSVPEYAAAGLNFDVAPLPIGPAGRATGVNSAGFVISADTDAPDAAWQFVQFAISEAGQAKLANIGLAVPILESVAKGEAYLGQPVQIDNALFVDALDYAHMKPVFRGYEEWSSAVGDALNLAWSGEEALADALAIAAEDGDAALAKNQ